MAKPSDALVSAFQVSVNGETSALPAGASTSARWFNESRHARRSRPGTSSADGLRYIGVHEAPGGRWLNESFLELSQSALRSQLASNIPSYIASWLPPTAACRTARRCRRAVA